MVLVGLINPSCTNLDEEVYSDLTGKNFFSDPENLIYAFGTAYTNLYQLVGHKYGMVGIENGTDLTCVPQRGGDWFDGGEFHRWHRHTWSPTEGYVQRWWNVIFYGINTCNSLILQFELVEDADTKPAISELRALRALYYYWLIDIYGNVPISDRFDVPDDYQPETKSRAEVYAWIESELLDVMGDLSKETGLAYFGRMNYYAAQMVLAKLYLNAEVYTGTAQWQKALTAVDSIYNSNKYSLSADFFDNFEEDATSSPEYILGLAFDQIEARQFEIHLFTNHYNMAPVFKFEDNTWNGICFQEAFFNSFEEGDLRLGGLMHGKQYDAEGNQVEDPSYEQFDPQNPTILDPDGIGLNLTPYINMLEPNCLRQCGARVAKFPFIEGSDRYTGNDFPIFRYADLLLMKAELHIRLGLGGADGLIDEVRARAGVGPLGSYTLEDLLAERARELYAEGHRRSDMIRFGVYGDPRWEKEDQSAPHTSIWPIPESQIQVNPMLQQNPGY